MKTSPAGRNTGGNEGRRRLIDGRGNGSEMRQNRLETAGNGAKRRRQGRDRVSGRLVDISAPYRERRRPEDVFSFRREAGQLGMIPTGASHNNDYVNYS